jgi:hypothetical protein
LKDAAIVMDLHERAPVGRWAPGGRDGRRFERFAQVREDLAEAGNEQKLLASLTPEEALEYQGIAEEVVLKAEVAQ